MIGIDALERRMLFRGSEIYGRITWLTHFACNYRCTYCFYYEGAGWEILNSRNRYFSPDEWLARWENLYQQYGHFAVLISGGEPFIYPHFTKIVKRLSEIHFPINITTNASGDISEWADELHPEKISFTLSYHPQFENLDNFIKKVLFLRKQRFTGFTNFVAYPPFIKDIPRYLKKFSAIGERFKVIPFRGIFRENAYPWSYTKEEIGIMGIDPTWFEKIKKRGRQCIAGKRTAILLPDGNMSRCGQLFYNCILGNFFDPGFKLLEEYTPCNVELCPCDEDKIFEDGDLEFKKEL